MNQSRTQEFKKTREETKQLVAQILAEKMNHFDNNRKTEPRVDGLSSFIVSMVSQGFCPACGTLYSVLSKPVSCCICRHTFCSDCVKPLSNETVVAVMDFVKDGNYSCEKCSLVMRLQQASTERKSLRAAKTASPLVSLYQDFADARKNLETWIPQYEYLVASITEIQQSHSNQQKEDESWGASYSAVKTTERKLSEMFNSYQQASKPLITFCASSPSEALLVKNINQAYIDYLKIALPRFKDIQQRVGREELGQAAKVYLFLQQLAFETQYHSLFRGDWGSLFSTAITSIRKEIIEICVGAAGEPDWTAYEETLQKRNKRRQKALNEDPSKALILQKKTIPKGVPLDKTVAALAEPILLRKVMNLVKQMSDRFSARRIHAPVTNKMLGFVLHEFESFFNSVLAS